MFVIGSFYNTFCINILLHFCLFTSFSIAVGDFRKNLPLVYWLIGGASGAAYNDLPDRVHKKHGRWKSERAKYTYYFVDIQHQLLVALNIGIMSF